MPIQKEILKTKEGFPVLCEEANEAITFSTNNINLILQTKDYGKGTLYLTTKRLIWICENEKNEVVKNTISSLAIDYYTINLHAISRDSSTYSRPCIYCQLSGEEFDEKEENTEKKINKNEDIIDNDDIEDDEAKTVELLLMPEHETNLEKIFKVMSDMSALNPNPNNEYMTDDDESDEEDDIDDVQIDNKDEREGEGGERNCQNNINLVDGWIPEGGDDGMMEDAIDDTNE